MCTSVLSSQVSDCEPLNQSFVKTDASWISYTNETEPNGYIIHSHCPFDYCLPPSNAVRINFNMANGADAQCNHNRHGILCYACYWTGLLLLVRIILYLITILNFNRNPHTTHSHCIRSWCTTDHSRTIHQTSLQKKRTGRDGNHHLLQYHSIHSFYCIHIGIQWKSGGRCYCVNICNSHHADCCHCLSCVYLHLHR